MACYSSINPDHRVTESEEVRSLLMEVGLIPKKDYVLAKVMQLDKDTADLCKFCKEHNVKDYSLELQIWWRDHQKRDKEISKK